MKKVAQLYIQAPTELIQFKDIFHSKWSTVHELQESPTIPWLTILSHTVTIAVTQLN